MITHDFAVWAGAPDVPSEPYDTVPVAFALPTPPLDHEDLWLRSQPLAR